MKRLLTLALALCMMLPMLAGVASADEKIHLVLSAGSEYQTLVDAFMAANPDIDVEIAPTDTATIEQVHKTAIAAGDPADVCTYWGTRVNTFYDLGMCKDLRDYLSEETIAKLSTAMLDPCLGENGEVWAIPYNAVYHVMFYNKDMMTKYGFEEPKTWDDLTAIFARLKEDDVFGFCTNSVSMQDCAYGLAYSELEAIEPGLSYKVASGEVSVLPGTPAGDAIAKVINQMMDWYKAGYWYPGDGGINCSSDDANAAFAQGRTMFIFNYSGALGKHVSSCDFEIGWMMKPVRAEGMTSYENTEPNVFFIPVNVKEDQAKAAARLLEFMVSQEGQQIAVDKGFVPAVPGATYENVHAVLEGIIANLDSGCIVSGINPTRTSSEMQTFIKKQVFAAPCAGIMTVDQTLEEMERMRLEAIGQ